MYVCVCVAQYPSFFLSLFRPTQNIKSAIGFICASLYTLTSSVPPDMAQVRLEAAEAQNSQLLQDLKDIKAALSLLDTRMVRAQEMKHKRREREKGVVQVERCVCLPSSFYFFFVFTIIL